jgi:putative NADH-flavin reductase
MKITVFGSIGRTGQQVVQQALEAGHEVVAFARTPSKLALQNPRLTIVAGDIKDVAAVNKAITGAEAVISVLGPTSNQVEYAVSNGTQHIIAAMQTHGVKRLIISAGAGVGDPNDAPKLFDRLIVRALKIASKHVYEDMVKTVVIVKASDRDWTIVRVPMLTDGEQTGRVKVGFVGKGTGARITRADMADFMLKQLKDDTYLKRAPVVSN